MFSSVTPLAALMALSALATATQVHANVGCIDVADQPVCSPGSISIAGGSATIYAQFNSGNQFPTQVPGCILNANWPVDYADIYFGGDNCLYDGNSQVINGQCCINGSGGSTPVRNPYA